jgi:hypothetical protein
VGQASDPRIPGLRSCNSGRIGRCGHSRPADGQREVRISRRGPTALAHASALREKQRFCFHAKAEVRSTRVPDAVKRRELRGMPPVPDDLA